MFVSGDQMSKYVEAIELCGGVTKCAAEAAVRSTVADLKSGKTIVIQPQKNIRPDGKD